MWLLCLTYGFTTAGGLVASTELSYRMRRKNLSVKLYIRGLSNQHGQTAIFLIFGPIRAWQPFVTDWFYHLWCKHALRARNLSPIAASSHTCRRQVKFFKSHNRLETISWRGYEPRIIPHRRSDTTRPAIIVTGMAIWRFARYHAYDRNKVSEGKTIRGANERTLAVSKNPAVWHFPERQVPPKPVRHYDINKISRLNHVTTRTAGRSIDKQRSQLDTFLCVSRILT